MSFVNSLLKIFVGDKSKKDVQQVKPIVDKVKTFEKALQELSHDQLREKTTFFKQKIKEARLSKDNQIAQIREKIEQTDDIDKREDLYLQIDTLEKEAYEISEATLNELLPEAFAVVKETARRFKENTAIEVTATPKDLEFSATKAYVTIEGDKAIWANSWNAAGKPITWD